MHEKIFIVGAPRSGTTWLQLLLSQHPQIATCQETHFFSGYMRKWFSQWDKESRSSVERDAGLKSVLSHDEFLDMCRASSDYLFDQVLNTKPGATHVLEKTPVHVRYINVIHELYPDSHFIHMVRDPRSVVASLLAASSDWGRTWRGQNIRDFTELWNRSIRQWAARKSHINGREVLYERLRGDTSVELLELFRWLNIDADSEFCDQAVAACDLEKLRNGGSQSAGAQNSTWPAQREPKNFFRGGKLNSWTSELNQPQIALIEKSCYSHMQIYGYRPEIYGKKYKGLARVLELYYKLKSKFFPINP